MYPTDLDAIDWGVIYIRDIISNINNMDFHIGPLLPSFSTFDATDTKTTKGSSNNEQINQPSTKIPEKSKAPMFKMNPRLENRDSDTTKSKSIFQDTWFETSPNMLS